MAGNKGGGIMAVKMTEQVRRHLNDVLEDDGSETGGTSFEGETLENFISETFSENAEPITMKAVNKALKECGIRPVEDWNF